jgi:LmbE family N-acetylglucosaminyl deacetylase
MTWRWLPATFAAAAVGLAPHAASTQVTPVRFDQGATGLGLALRQLPVEGSVLYVTAHPDDENNGVLVALNRGRGLKTALLTVTRGDGGQNEIGPELFQAIGILRSEELAGVHKFDGADQYFTRAYEFGYSFSVEETFDKWGREEILRDVVRVVRSVRPDVMLTMNRDGTAGGQHHMGSARLAQEAFRAAADPARFPEQIAEGLRPWQARKIYQAAGGPGGGGQAGAFVTAPGQPAPGAAVRVSTGDYDALLGMSWAQFGQLARAYHQCQGTGQLEAYPGAAAGTYALYDSEPRVQSAESDPLDGIDTSLGRLARFAAGEEARLPSLARDLTAIEASARAALDAFDARAPHKTLPHLSAGLARVRQLRAAVDASALSAGPKAELGWRLDRKAADFAKALQLAQGLVVYVTASDGNVVRGQTFRVTAQVFNTGPEPVAVGRVALNVPAGWTAERESGDSGSLAYNTSATYTYAVTVGPGARFSQPYWKLRPGVDRYDIEVPEHHTLPWSPPDVTATVAYVAAGVDATVTAPAIYRYDGPWVGGEKQKVVNIVPALSVKLTPSVAVVPIAAAGSRREFRVTVANNTPAGGTATVRLETPAGWRVEPASATLTFGVEEEEVTAQFFVTPPARLTPGSTSIRAVATRDGQSFAEGYQVIAYHHIQSRHLYHPATSSVKIVDVTVPAALQVGYVMGTGDEVPEALRQLGATVTMLGPDDVAFGDLSRFSTIVLGIRAYEKRADVRAYNQRLLDFARAGGHLVVQYNKVAMNQLGAGAAGSVGGFGGGARGGAGAGGRGAGAGGAGLVGAPPAGTGGRGGRGAAAPPASPYVPFPGGVTSNRVSVEEAPIRVLEEGTVELTGPNRITAADFQGWVQERGLYFFGAGDPRYTDLLGATDPWPNNPGEKRGLLTVAKLGRGTWTYVGLGLWRQLPAGTVGAYRIMANLIARPRG